MLRAFRQILKKIVAHGKHLSEELVGRPAERLVAEFFSHINDLRLATAAYLTKISLFFGQPAHLIRPLVFIFFRLVGARGAAKEQNDDHQAQRVDQKFHRLLPKDIGFGKGEASGNIVHFIKRLVPEGGSFWV